jgi:hypothetical protein
MKISNYYIIKQVVKTIVSACFLYSIGNYLNDIFYTKNMWLFVIVLLLITPFLLFHIISILFVFAPPKTKYKVIDHEIEYHKLQPQPSFWLEFVLTLIVFFVIGTTHYRFSENAKWAFYSSINVLFIWDFWTQLKKLNEFPFDLLQKKKIVLRTVLPQVFKKAKTSNELYWMPGQKFDVELSETNIVNIIHTIKHKRIRLFKIKSEILSRTLGNKAFQFVIISEEEFEKENLNKNQAQHQFHLAATLVNKSSSQFIDIELELKEDENWNKLIALRSKLIALKRKQASIRLMTVVEAEKIVKEYGKILANNSELNVARPISMLPCSKEEIIHAIKLYIKVVPQESKSTLRGVYTTINFFVDDELVSKINNIDWATASEEDRKIHSDFASKIAEGFNIPEELWT